MDKETKEHLEILTEEVKRREDVLLKIREEENEVITQINKCTDNEVKKKLLMQLEEVNARSLKAHDKYVEALTLLMVERKM